MKNKTQGSNWERRVVDLLSTVLNLEKFNNTNSMTAEIGSSRQFDRNLDAKGIDIWFKTIRNLHIQCKKTICNGKTVKTIDISSLDRIMNNDGIRAVVVRTTKKPLNAKRETSTGEYAVVPMEDFLKLLTIWRQSEELKLSGNIGNQTVIPNQS